MKNASGLSAGFVLIIVLLVCTLAGVYLLGAVVGRVPGGFVGGLAGIVIGFVVVYRMYLVPLRKQSEARDYSNLRPQLDDDD